jgi:hypothetical protein
MWENVHMPKALVPKRQLYPAPFPAHITGFVWNDRNSNQFFDEEDERLREVAVALYRAEDTSLTGIHLTDSLGRYRFDFLKEGSYFLQFSTDLTGKELIPGIQLDFNGRTPSFFLRAGEGRILDVFFIPDELLQQRLFSQVNAFPIPVTDRLAMEFTLAQAQPIRLYLLDQLGQGVVDQLWIGRKGLNRIPMNFSNYPAGVYYYRLYHESEQISGKIIKN